MRLPTLVRTGLAVVATAVAGGVATTPSADWYRDLSKPPWQPPPAAYGLVWTPLYADIAAVTAHTLDGLPPADRAGYRRAVAGNLVLNAAWSWLFWRSRRPWLAAAEAAALTVSSADLVRRTSRQDPRAGRALAPYPLWCAFATTLTVAIARRNPHGAPRPGTPR
jgi:tryptophan-rich sensory protein